MQHKNRDYLIKEIVEIYKSVFFNSPQGVYIYLDDIHRICNQKFAELLGYDSIEAWTSNKNPMEDVSEEDREKEGRAYYEAAENFKAVSLSVKYQKRDGKKVEADVIMCPIIYKDEIFVIHFVSKIT